MCGIAGFVNTTPAGAGDARALLGRMIGALRHRGPDADGFWSEEGAGLAHARLSIIDLEGGRQPMTNEDGSLWITFNGEVFNYPELRESLLGRGHRFATSSDTEVILHLYEEYGEECVHHMNGQWAFAIWDRNRRKLFLSRDRLGIRPLFYTNAGGAFLFASEIKALFAHPAVSREIDVRALDQIFTFWCTLPPQTMFRNVAELPPAHSLVFENGDCRVYQYWHLEYPASGSAARSEEEYSQMLLDLLVDATRIRLRSDVPVGAYLSGGLDSTVTTALIRKFTNAPLKTFSVTFEDQEFDESSWQQEAVQYLGTEHQDVRCRTEDVARVFPEVIWHTEKPVLRTAPAPLFLLSKLVRDSGFKVVMTGEGADEMLGGYDIFKEAKIRRFWQAHPESALRPLLLRRLYPYLHNIQAQPDAYRKAFFHIGSGADTGPFFSHEPRWELTARLKTFFSRGTQAQLAADASGKDIALPDGFGRWHWFAKAQYLETAYLLPGYILSSQGDRVAMAHSVEGRFPFLDYRVAEFASTVPPELKMKVLNEKYLLKRSVNGLVPPRIKKRPKQPYRAPDGKCFVGRNCDYVRELLSPRRLEAAGLFAPRAVAGLLEKFDRGAAIGVKDNMALVGIISTQLVQDQFIDHFRGA